MAAAKQVFRAFKLQGLTLHADALKRLLREMDEQPSVLLEDVIYAIKNSIDRSKLTNSVVTQEALESALDTLLSVSTENDYQAIQVFSALEQPKLRYESLSKTYEVVADRGRRLHAAPEYRVNLFRERFAAVERRVRRHKTFSKPVMATTSLQREYLELTRIESLLGVSGVKRVLGMLGQDERNNIYLEDLTARIYINTDKTICAPGMYTLNSVVIVEGQVRDDVFHVESMGGPPPEYRADSIAILGGLDPLGVEVSAQQMTQIRELEAQDDLASFVILSDVHLDDPQVMKRLDRLFEGYAPFCPTLFVLMGNFTSTPVGYGQDAISIADFKELLDDLAAILLKYPSLVEHSKFVLVPGPDDPGAASVLPRHPLPDMCTTDFLRKIPSATMASNPCRIRYFTKDIVILRDDLQAKMRRNCLMPLEAAADDEDRTTTVSRQLVKTVIDQGHLCPLSLSAQPIHWAYDGSLQLFPLPDVLVLADKTDQFQVGYAGVAAIHPGPFYVDYSFMLYRPATAVTELSRID
ncbi:DNA polymerase epsilon subunit [Achlya hypogyna]|uniref:DNA polymerase epsilon subunit n=1 Tax=Achlya hypogyna TaxID=1202772 RepID=A0A1V9YX49_ACHHY|nr:DNA polymerase epsilon subunit [Achlya hypogyna]